MVLEKNSKNYKISLLCHSNAIQVFTRLKFCICDECDVLYKVFIVWVLWRVGMTCNLPPEQVFPFLEINTKHTIAKLLSLFFGYITVWAWWDSGNRHLHPAESLSQWSKANAECARSHVWGKFWPYFFPRRSWCFKKYEFRPIGALHYDYQRTFP